MYYAVVPGTVSILRVLEMILDIRAEALLLAFIDLQETLGQMELLLKDSP